MRKSLLILILTACFISCNSPAPTNSQADSASAVVADTPAQAIDQTPVTFTGIYTFGNEVNTFRDCTNQKTYWVNDSLATLRKAYEKTVQPLTYPYESIYAEIKGYLAGRSELGYASEYENVLVVTEIIKSEAKNLRTDCYDYEFIALGTEPFWSVDIVPTEQQIILKDLGQNKVYQFPYQPANIGGGVHRFETSNGATDKLVIVIREEPCSDGMSDNTYRYSAEVVIDGRTLTGCAVKKGDNIGSRP
ncbi:MAG TPA: hypothetical protein VLZ28_03740 [Daejeonella sp.]|nr:hypothetical protein [Daejeonella sp.]